jgi:hypothetical protein
LVGVNEIDGVWLDDLVLLLEAAMLESNRARDTNKARHSDIIECVIVDKLIRRGEDSPTKAR